MILVYNFLLTFFSLLLLPLIVPVVLIREKYRGRTLERLGWKSAEIKNKLAAHSSSGPVIWIHALSVGEVTSALPLAKAIRRDLPESIIVFSVATRSGRQIADSLIAPHADLILYSPFDLWFSVRRYISAIRPKLFILVETDFWPNWLRQLQSDNIPVMLVNGRISEKSFASYKRFLFVFSPMFRCFALLSMQTTEDAGKMIELGMAPERIITLGNLKFDMEIDLKTGAAINRAEIAVNENKTILVCGSTHPGEEDSIFAAFQQLVAADNELFLILAPRDISRGRELVSLAQQFNLKARTRKSRTRDGNVLILDTIGELAACYSLARLAFVGGSLVACGGHNPIEPAAYAVPVLFGSHMEDFAEIADDLVACGGAQVVTPDSLAEAAAAILYDNARHAAMAEKARQLVERHRGGLARHIQAIHTLLTR